MSLKKLLTICAALSICACAGTADRRNSAAQTGSSRDSNYWITRPKPGELVILGVSGKQSTRDAEIQIAREDAARKVSMYHRVWANVNTVQRIGSGYLDYYVNTEKIFEYDLELEKYIEKLNFDPERDVFRNNSGAVFIRFGYPAIFPGALNYKSGKNSNDSPEWTTRPPHEIGGYKAGVGSSGRLERIGDTIKKSYEDAAASIVSYYYSSVRIQDTVIGGQSDSFIYSQSKGRIAYFLVLETWIDPKSGAVYTLAIGKQAN